jgi:hypothetical protein
MKKLIIIFLLFAGTVSAQTMLVSKPEVKLDPVYTVLRNNYKPLSDYLSDQISESLINGDSAKVEQLSKVKKQIWAVIKEYRNATTDSTVVIDEVDSLKTIQIIERNTAEIKVLKKKMSACPECNTEVLQKMINTLQDQKNEAVMQSKNWVKKPEPKKEIINANTDR